MNVLLDSWAWIEVFKGTDAGRKVITEVKKAGTAFTTAVNLYEVCYRIREDEGEERMMQAQSFIEHRATILDIDKKIAFAAVHVRLKERLQAIDSFTLAAARLNAAKVVSGDPHFKGIKDVIYCGR